MVDDRLFGKWECRKTKLLGLKFELEFLHDNTAIIDIGEDPISCNFVVSQQNLILTGINSGIEYIFEFNLDSDDRLWTKSPGKFSKHFMSRK